MSSEDFDFDILNFPTGWVDDPAIRFAAKKEFGYSSYMTVISATADASERPRKVDLTKYLERCHGKDWELNQGTCGSCVSFSNALAVDILEAIDCLENGAELPPRTCTEAIYWGSRVDIGGGRLMGAGSVNAWAAEAVKRIGILPRGKYESGDFTVYDAGRCCGPRSRQLLTKDLKSEAARHVVQDYAQIQSWDELIDSIAAGYPCPIASNQGFSQQRDSHSIAEARGHWGHSMCVVGYDLDLDCVMIANSWGKFFHGGDLHQACFYARRPVVERMIGADDTFALSNIKGWPRKKLNLGMLNL